jgi:hypothetical protein
MLGTCELQRHQYLKLMKYNSKFRHSQSCQGQEESHPIELIPLLFMEFKKARILFHAILIRFINQRSNVIKKQGSSEIKISNLRLKTL